MNPAVNFSSGTKDFHHGLLGVSPIPGRTFTQQEEDAYQPVAVISYSLWMDRYHRDPHVLGTSIVLDRKTYLIIGVMPRNFDFPPTAGPSDKAQLWVPMSLTADELSDEHARILRISSYRLHKRWD